MVGLRHHISKSVSRLQVHSRGPIEELSPEDPAWLVRWPPHFPLCSYDQEPKREWPWNAGNIASIFAWNTLTCLGGPYNLTTLHVSQNTLASTPDYSSFAGREYPAVALVHIAGLTPQNSFWSSTHMLHSSLGMPRVRKVLRPGRYYGNHAPPRTPPCHGGEACGSLLLH